MECDSKRLEAWSKAKKRFLALHSEKTRRFGEDFLTGWLDLFLSPLSISVSFLCLFSSSLPNPNLFISFIPFLLTLPHSPLPRFSFPTDFNSSCRPVKLFHLYSFSSSLNPIYKLYQWVCGFKMDEHKKWSYKILSTLGVLLHLVFVDLARDFIRWINLKPKVIFIISINENGKNIDFFLAILLSILFNRDF